MRISVTRGERMFQVGLEIKKREASKVKGKRMSQFSTFLFHLCCSSVPQEQLVVFVDFQLSYFVWGECVGNPALVDASVEDDRLPPLMSQ